jgi:hypothetical protein
MGLATPTLEVSSFLDEQDLLELILAKLRRAAFSAALQVHLLEHQLFLKPNLDEDTPTSDPMVQGTYVVGSRQPSRADLASSHRVTLFLPKARTLRHLSVRVIGRQDIGWSDHRPHESFISLDREVTLHDSLSSKNDDDGAHLKLEKGEHTWEFSILIPSSTPTYERSPWGRVRHRVIARAKGLGKLGSEVTSVEQELMLVVNVSLFEPTAEPSRSDRRNARRRLAFRNRATVAIHDGE